MQSNESRLGTALTVARAAGVFKRLDKIFDDDVLEENKARTLRLPDPTHAGTPTTTMPPMHRVSLRCGAPPGALYEPPDGAHSLEHVRVAPLPPTPQRCRTEALSRNAELRESSQQLLHALRCVRLHVRLHKPAQTTASRHTVQGFPGGVPDTLRTCMQSVRTERPVAQYAMHRVGTLHVYAAGARQCYNVTAHLICCTQTHAADIVPSNTGRC